MPKLELNRLKEVANQLRCPEGKQGIEIGKILNSTNSNMIEESINALDLVDKNRILELGHGNCGHLNNLLQRKKMLKYFGMEISEEMKNEAERINNESSKRKRALFQLYDGYNIDYVSNFFDRILTVNTIYFIDNPLTFLHEVHRVLKPGGICVVSFADRNFMKELPFVLNNTIFTLYDREKIKDLLKKTDFILLSIDTRKERVKSKSGDWVDKVYLITKLAKKFRKESFD